MNNLFVNCNNCGEQLQIEDEIMFTTCRSCGSTLEIVRTFNSIYTKVTNDVVEKPYKIATKEKPQRLKLVNDEVHNQLVVLDKEWENQLTQVTTKGRSPSDNNVTVFIITIVGFIVLSVWLFKAITSEAHLIFTLLGVVLSFSLLFYVVRFIVKQQRYNAAKDDYEKQRTQLLNQLNQ